MAYWNKIVIKMVWQQFVVIRVDERTYWQCHISPNLTPPQRCLQGAS